jgi:hypothetical protein
MRRGFGAAAVGRHRCADRVDADCGQAHRSYGVWPGKVGRRSCSRAQGGAWSKAQSGKVELLLGAMYNREREEGRHGKGRRELELELDGVKFSAMGALLLACRERGGEGHGEVGLLLGHREEGGGAP